MGEYLDENLPPLYKSKISILKNDLSAASSDLEKCKIIENFAKHYWIMPCFWDIYRHYKVNDAKELGIAIDFSILPRNSNYFKHIFWNDFEFAEDLCQNDITDGIMEAENALKFPCDALKEILSIKNFYATQPPKKNLKDEYIKTVSLKNELKKNWNNTETWSNILLKSENVEVVIANFEHRLSDNKFFIDKELWKKYIAFLKTVSKEMTFMAYKHYTRFFIDDYEMVSEYRKEIFKEKATSKMATKWLIDTIEWELYFGDYNNAYSLMTLHLNFKRIEPNDSFMYTCDELENILANERAQLKYFDSDVDMNNTCGKPKDRNYGNFNNIYKQQFDFPSPMSRHALNNVSLTLLQKLYQSCKFFYTYFKTPLCYRLVIGGSKTQYFQQSLQISDADYLKPHFQELIRRMNIVNCLQWQLKSDEKSFSNTFRNMKLENIRCLYVKDQIITISDFYYFFFRITEMRLNCFIQNSNGVFLTQEELLNSKPV